MADLIICEFAKIKRRKFILFCLLAAGLFPIPLTVLAAKDVVRFELLFRMAVMFGDFLLLPCVLSVVASILFFTERDSDTLKNLMTVPVSKTKLAAAKLFVLLLMSVLYSVAGLGATVVGGMIVGGVEGIAAKSGISVILGIMLFVAVLPMVILIVYFNKSYIFTILISFIYAILNFAVGLIQPNLPPGHVLTILLPGPVIMRWYLSAYVVSEVGGESPAGFQPYLLSTPMCAGILALITVISVLLISLIYERQEG